MYWKDKVTSIRRSITVDLICTILLAKTLDLVKMNVRKFLNENSIHENSIHVKCKVGLVQI